MRENTHLGKIESNSALYEILYQSSEAACIFDRCWRAYRAGAATTVGPV